MHVYAYCDWGSDRDTRRSTSGYVVCMAGGPVDWISKRQPIVTVSSIEAEYVACFFAVQVVVWIRQLLHHIGQQRSKPTQVFVDNSSARQLAYNPVHHQSPKTSIKVSLDPGYDGGSRSNLST